LQSSYTLFSLDLKGFGSSPKPLDDGYSIFDQAALVLRFMRDLDLHDVVLVGHSFGGGVALATLLLLEGDERSRVSQIVLIDTVAFPQPAPSFIRILCTPLIGPAVLELLPYAWQVRAVMRMAYHDHSKISDDMVQAYAQPMGLPGAHHALIQTARQLFAMAPEAHLERYGQLTVPALVVWGQHDEIIPLEIGQRLHRALPASSMVIVGDAGHVPHEESPEKTLEAIVRFLHAQTHIGPEQ
jgi:pimeloyl-ACP methyl ester carboxylesterase